MRYFRFVIGAIRMLFYSIVSFDRIKFIFPVKLEDGAKFSLRKNGKILRLLRKGTDAKTTRRKNRG